MILKNKEQEKQIKEFYRLKIKKLFGDRMFLTRTEAAKAKGEALGTLGGHRYLLPNGGEPDHIVRNIDCWTVDTVIEWCLIDRRQLRDYLKAHGYTDSQITEINNTTKRCKIL